MKVDIIFIFKIYISVGSLVKSRIDDKHAADVQEENLQPKMVLRSRRSIHKTVDPEFTKPKMGQTSNYSTFRGLFKQIKFTQ